MTSVKAKYDELIMSYLEGRCTAEEALSLLSWMAESEDNRAYFDSFKQVWDLTSFAFPETVDVEAALEAVGEKIDAQEHSVTKTIDMPWLRRNFGYLSGVAAALVLALFIGFLLRPAPMVTMASADWAKGTPYVLPDSSTVTFTGDAEIAYSKRFGEERRAMFFEGKACFDVTADASRPFVVHCNGVDVEVLGTTFVIDAPKEGHRVAVELLSGKVKMRLTGKTGKGASIVLSPKEFGVFYPETGVLKLVNYPEMKQEELANDHVLDFKDVSLATIVETLEYIFKIEVAIPETYRDEKMTARFTDKDAVDEVIETIATVFALDVAKHGEKQYQLR